jgi:hypothetical protein
MMERLLLCTDLDRTLLPNGTQPESPEARTRFSQLAARPEVSLAFVSGRHRMLVLAAIEEYQLPEPDFVIGDVGTNIYSVQNNHWRIWQSWAEEIAADWGALSRDELQALFADLDELRLQEAEKQNRFKLSYYAAPDVGIQPILTEMEHRMSVQHIKASLIWSVDETIPIGLLDVLPARANKLHAIEFLMQQQGFTRDNTVFAGDSGNDLPVLISPVNSVLVGNALAEVKQQALQQAEARNALETLYLAKGGFMGMNGNYSAGILEGLAHYHPVLAQWWN